MCENLMRWVSLVLVSGLAGGTSADAIAPQRFYSDATGSNATSYSSDPNAAQPPDGQPAAQTMPYPGLRRNAFDLGTEVYYFHYEEPGLMEEEGVFYGVRVGCTGRGWIPASPQASSADGGTMFRAEGRFAFGQVDYDGGIIDLDTGAVTPCNMDDIDDWVFEGRLLLGADWLYGSALNTVYAGIGYRYLNDDSSFDPAGYERESNYLYVPIGYEFDSSHMTGWSFGFGAEFDVFIVGNQRSHLSDVDPAYSDVDNRQNSGYGCRASVRLQHKTEAVIFSVEPFIRYWNIDDSEVEYETFGTLIEPANETTEYGISVLLMF